MAWYWIVTMVATYVLVGALVVAFLEESMEWNTDESTVVFVIFWPLVIVVTLLILVFEGLELVAFLVRGVIKKILKWWKEYKSNSKKQEGLNMEGYDYKTMMEKQYAYLDKIDMEKYLRNCSSDDVSDLMSNIEKDYNNTELTNNDFLKGFIFNVCDEYEFIEYLRKRYGERFHSYDVTHTMFSFK